MPSEKTFFELLSLLKKANIINKQTDIYNIKDYNIYDINFKIDNSFYSAKLKEKFKKEMQSFFSENNATVIEDFIPKEYESSPSPFEVITNNLFNIKTNSAKYAKYNTEKLLDLDHQYKKKKLENYKAIDESERTIEKNKRLLKKLKKLKKNKNNKNKANNKI